jgi:hypothetical protein
MEPQSMSYESNSSISANIITPPRVTPFNTSENYRWSIPSSGGSPGAIPPGVIELSGRRSPVELDSGDSQRISGPAYSLISHQMQGPIAQERHLRANSVASQSTLASMPLPSPIIPISQALDLPCVSVLEQDARPSMDSAKLPVASSQEHNRFLETLMNNKEVSANE